MTTVGLLAVVFLLTQSPVEMPRPGAVQKLTVLTLSLQVGSLEKETRQVTYTPPPGWYVRSHRVECTRKIGNASFSVATVPQNWAWVSEEKVEESYKTLIDLAGKAGHQGLQARFAKEREQALVELRRVRSTHHALILDAAVRGEGFLRNGGALDLTVTAELVFHGTDETLERTVARHKATLAK